MQPILGGPRADLDEAAVVDALSLSRGAHVRHGADILTLTGAETGEALRFEASGSFVTWSYRAPDRVVGQSASVAAVRRRATLVGPQTDGIDPASILLRLWTEWQMLDASWCRFDLGVFYVVNPGALMYDGVVARRSWELYDKSHRWANTPLAGPLTVPAGTEIIAWIKASLTAQFGETHFALASSAATLEQARTFEDGTSWLQVYSSLLQAAGFDQLTADETGAAASQPLAGLAEKGPEVTYGAGLGKVVTAGQVEPLLSTVPNVVRFSARQGPSLGNVEGNGQRTVKNQSTGPASIDQRGYEVELRVDVDADSQAVLDEIAAADAQRYFAGGGLRWQGKVGLNPRHSDRDVIGLDLPWLELTDGAWSVTDWTYPLSDLTDEAGALMPITAERRVVTS